MAKSVTEQMGVNLLLELPGVNADNRASYALRQLDKAMAEGDTCISIRELAQNAKETSDGWIESLRASGLVGGPDDRLPIIIDDDLLTSRRYYAYEAAIANVLLRRCGDLSQLKELQADDQVATDIAKIFPRSREALVNGVDWQRLAACVALAHGAAIITGGPGTGKTTVAGKVIAIAARQRARRDGGDVSVFIAAPTGKAAQRLRESLINTGQSLVAKKFLTAAQLEHLTQQVGTLHRLVFDRRLTGADLVVIDEVSMADAATLSRVLQRIPETTKILLLGDPEQLASVDAGHVLGELAKHSNAHVSPALADWYATCGGKKEPVPRSSSVSALGRAQVHLQKNWRSKSSPAVSGLATAIQESPFAVSCLWANPSFLPEAGVNADRNGEHIPVFIERRDLPNPETLMPRMLEEWTPWASDLVSAESPAEALEILSRRRLLTARRTGPLGAAWVNQALEEVLERDGRIHPWDTGHYHGRPLLVTRNNYDLQLFNGDIGIIWGQRDDAKAYFPEPSGELRAIQAHRLDAVEPVFAMSIHKSQGSQFDHVDVITAADDDHPGIRSLLTRELIYTGVTRAAYSAVVWANDALLTRALERRTIRRTGLGRFLRI